MSAAVLLSAAVSIVGRVFLGWTTEVAVFAFLATVVVLALIALLVEVTA